MGRPIPMAVLALGCLGAAAIGWSIGKSPSPVEHEIAEPPPAVSSLPQKRPGEIVGDYRTVASDTVSLRGDRTADDITRLLQGARRTTKLGADPVALAILSELSAAEIAGVLPELMAIDPRPEALIAAAVGRWAETDPEEAIQWAKSELDRPGFAAARSAIVAAWAKDDPEAAIAWLRDQLANAPRKGRYQIESDFNTLVNIWARADPAAALRAVIDQELPGTYSKWWGFSQLVKHDDRRDEVFELVLAIEDEAVRQKGLENLVGAWSDDNPRAAAAWLDTNGYTDRKTQWSVSQRFARADPEANADWLLARSTDDTRESSISTAIAYWVRSDPGAAEAWIEKNELVNDRSISQLATGWATRDTERAIRWALRLEDEARRPAMVGDVLQQRRNRDYNRGIPYDQFDFTPFTKASGIDAAELKVLTDAAQQRANRRW